MSARVFDAENRARVEMGIPAVRADAQPVKSELEWKKGSDEYTTSPSVSSETFATCAPVRPNRPCVHRTALGDPVDPDVKISRKRSSSVAGDTDDGEVAALTISP